jgi:hypothetical protein
MADEQPEGGSETGGSLRAKYEAALDESRQLAAELIAYKAKDVIQEKGYKFVTPEDLKGVGLNELAARAEAVEKQKLEIRETVLRDALAGQGLEGERLDDAVRNLLNPQESHAETSTRLAGLGRINGTFPAQGDTDGLEGRDLIRAAVAENANKRR